MIYFPTNGGAKEPQNLPNHRLADFMVYEINPYTTMGSKNLAGYIPNNIRISHPVFLSTF